jgi:hypothetical protein
VAVELTPKEADYDRARAMNRRRVEELAKQRPEQISVENPATPTPPGEIGVHGDYRSDGSYSHKGRPQYMVARQELASDLIKSARNT